MSSTDALILIILILMFVVTCLSLNEDMKEMKLRSICEFNLPRNQECVMQFIPQNKEP